MSEYARRAAEHLVAAPLQTAAWHIHGVGLDGGETGTDTLEARLGVAFEPMFSVDEDADDMEAHHPRDRVGPRGADVRSAVHRRRD